MKIAILFKDNDFGNTFYFLLRTFNSAYKHANRLPTDKSVLATIINEMSYPCYLLAQSPGEIDPSMREYLRIDECKILLNDEVDEYIKKTDWNNSETFILDTSLDYSGDEWRKKNQSVFSI
jgi:hypothetical protein